MSTDSLTPQQLRAMADAMDPDRWVAAQALRDLAEQKEKQDGK